MHNASDFSFSIEGQLPAEDKPVWEHDCDVCIYLGAEGPRPGEPRTNRVDMYCHPNHGSVIRRYSSRPDDYAAVPVEIARNIEKYQTNYRIMQMRGLHFAL